MSGTAAPEPLVELAPDERASDAVKALVRALGVSERELVIARPILEGGDARRIRALVLGWLDNSILDVRERP
jgi:hypothetical protein